MREEYPQDRPWCPFQRAARAEAGAYWLGMLGFALVGPGVTERAAMIFEEIDPLFVDGVLRGRIYDARYGWDPR